MSKHIKLKQGFDINLVGKAERITAKVKQPKTFALKPTDFQGMAMPKVLVKEGETVKAGTPILFDKKMDSVMYCAPVSGEIVAVERGDKRKLLSIRILADNEMVYEDFGKYTVSDLKNLSLDDARSTMLKAGVWPQIVQRPYATIANPEDKPKAIFISAFDTHPLAPDYEYALSGCEKYFQTGVDILKRFTDGKVHVNINAEAEVSKIFGPVKNAVVNQFSGAHPAGCVGVQIHHIDPINPGDLVWTVSPFGVIQIGKLFLEGKYDASRKIALAGGALESPQYFDTYTGACVETFIEACKPKDDNYRVISGNVLTGEKIAKDYYIGFYDGLLSVIPEGDKPRFFLTDGWLAPTAKRLSFHRAFGLLSFLNPSNKEYNLDTNNNGEERAFVMTGAFEQVVPMDILPTQLLKAIMAEDFDEMEALGIYEVVEEDLALCEFIDVSKHDIQGLLRKGLDMMRQG